MEEIDMNRVSELKNKLKDHGNKEIKQNTTIIWIIMLF